MGKFTYAVLMVYIIEFALYLFGGPGVAETSFFSLLFNPSTILSNPLYSTVILVTLGAFALSAIIPGNLWQVNVYALYAGVALVMITFGFSLVHFWQFFTGELAGIVSRDTMKIIAAIFISPLVWLYLVAILEWVRNN